jgi:putative (di)nucleoside polyphosphate hydrolase
MTVTLTPERLRLPYRDCAGIAVFNAKGQVFIGRRKPEDDPEDSAEHGSPWQMPQGGIDKGEDPLEAAKRELFEESNIRSVELIEQNAEWIHYDLPDDELGRALKGKYRGQRQLWFAFRFIGAEREIDVEQPGGGKFEAEFDAWRWEALERMPDIIVPFKREAYIAVVKAFAHLPEQVRKG